MGQCVDEAIAKHDAAYPGATVYAVRCIEILGSPTYRVELDASHFSGCLVYHITIKL